MLSFRFSVPYRLLSILQAAFCLALLAGMLCYICSSYENLCTWYRSLHGCIYNDNRWTTDFFTPATKQRGNLFCAAGLAVVLPAGIYTFLHLWQRKGKPEYVPLLNRGSIAWYAAILLLAAGLWMWSNRLQSPSFDEAFSAVNCAGIHPFQTASYYMLPNNHVLFNLGNNLLFHWMQDKVASGRLLSLGAYLLLGCWLLYCFSSYTGKHTAGFAITVVLLLHLPTWGFAGQARGYALYNLATWVAFGSLLFYVQTRKSKWLLLLSLATVSGFALIPSFLYCYAALAIFAILQQLWARKPDWRFWKWTAGALAATFFFYLPAICFSGMQSLTANPYVQGAHGSMSAFAKDFGDTAKYYISSFFSGFTGAWDSYIGYLLLLLPLLLLAWKSRRKAALAYLLMWCIFTAFVFAMLRYPYARNLTPQFSITLGLALLAIWQLLQPLPKLLPVVMLFAVTMLLGIHFFRIDADSNGLLYGVDWNIVHADLKKLTDTIPAGSVVGCSDESFYDYYLLKRRGIDARQCPDGSETYYISTADDVPQPQLTAHYTIVAQVGDETLYRHN